MVKKQIQKQVNTLYFGASRAPQVAGNATREAARSLLDSEYLEQMKALQKGSSKPKALRSMVVLGKRKAAVSESKPLVVGVWDIDVHSGFLYRVLDRVNRSQRVFRFHPVEATVPVGLTTSGDRTRALAHQQGFEPSKKDLARNTLASDIYSAAAPIRKKLGVDLLVAMISPMIMDLDTTAGEAESWNLFSTSKDGVVIASAYDLRNYARKAKRSFEACLAAIVAAAVVQELYPTVASHDKTVGCVFDYCDDRDDIVKGLKTINVCKTSLEQVPEATRASVEKMFDAIREYTP